MSEKKVVKRSVAVALGIVCIILAVSLVGAFAYYIPIVNNDNNTISSLTSIVSLANSTVWVNDETVSQGAGAYTNWTFSASYAGYVSVFIQTSTVSGTHVQVVYSWYGVRYGVKFNQDSSYGVNFNQEITVSAGSSAVFPLLPSSSITVGVGNGNILSSATETVTITYYY
jgi:hypothetical protein